LIGRPPKLSLVEMQQAGEAYRSGTSVAKVAESLGCSRRSVMTALKHLGVVCRSYEEAAASVRLTKRLDAFDDLSDVESAYWIGFLMADGCVHKTMIVLTLAVVDEKHVEAFRDFLRSTVKIGTVIPKGFYGQPQRQLIANSKHLVAALARYGIVPRKTYTATAAGGVELNRDFWRGVVDGDGSIWIGQYKCDPHPYARMSICGASRVLMEQFAAFVRLIYPSWRGGVNPYKKYWRVQLGASVATKVITELYRDCAVALDRKLEKAKRVMELGLPTRSWVTRAAA